jgi:hypothetical protein
MANIKDQSDEELLKEYQYWNDKVKNATSWGAALTAADEFRRECYREINLRGLLLYEV